jgi:hypothetical protein
MDLEAIIQTIEENCCLDQPAPNLSELLEHQSILASGGDYWSTTTLEDTP